MKPFLLLSLVLCLVTIPLTLPAQGQESQNRNLVHAQGTAQVTGQNDSAKVQLSIQTEAKAMQEAAAENAVRTEAVLEALRKLKFQDLKIQTQNYRVIPQKDFKARPPVIRGYEVHNEILVTAEGLSPKELSESIASVVETALASGANTVRNIQFYVKDKKSLEKQGLTLATRDAMDQARILAEAAGVRLGRIVSISTRPLAVPLRSDLFRAASMAEPKASVKPPIEPGESTIQVSVNVVHEIE